MATTGWIRPVAAVVIVVAAIAAYRWWASDERAIRRQLSGIARSLTVTGEEASLGRVTRLAGLAKALAPDIRVSIEVPPQGGPAATVVVGREAVLGLASRWVPPPGGATVEFVDVEISVADADAGALVSCTAVVATQAPAGQPSIDARGLSVGFRKLDGTWVVTSVEPVEALER